MMDKNVTPLYADMKRALASAVSAHQAIMEGIATHAEKHTAALDQARKDAEHEQRISDGIERARNQV